MAYLLNKDVIGQCSHGGSASASSGSARVKIAGSEVLTVAAQLTVSGCSNKLPNGSPFPCALAMFAQGATRVKVMGQPVLLDSSTASNLPTGASTSLSEPQTRVKGT